MARPGAALTEPDVGRIRREYREYFRGSGRRTGDASAPSSGRAGLFNRLLSRDERALGAHRARERDPLVLQRALSDELHVAVVVLVQAPGRSLALLREL